MILSLKSLSLIIRSWTGALCARLSGMLVSVWMSSYSCYDAALMWHPAVRWQPAVRQVLIAALCACNGVYLRHLRLRAIWPCATFAGFANPPLVGTGPLTPLKALMALIQRHHPPQCFSGARGHGGLSTAGTINAHCRAMRLQRRLSTAFAATGPSGPAPTFAGANFGAVIRNYPTHLGERKWIRKLAL